MLTHTVVEDESFKVNVTVRMPDIKPPKGAILALPGWNLPVYDWCRKTTLCDKALAQGYAIILPEMKKSVYSTRHYPETRKDFRNTATVQWFSDTFIPEIQLKYGLLHPRRHNFVIGLSTGARGAASLSLKHPEIFMKAALLSGDYDQTRHPGDRLMIAEYGPMHQFPERWKNDDNIAGRVKEFRIPLYIGHGMADKVVSAGESIDFCNRLNTSNPDIPVVCNIASGYGHDYTYWKSEIDTVMRFFIQTNINKRGVR